MDEQRLITAPEAAKLLGMSLSRVRQLYRVENQLNCYRNCNGEVRLDKTEVIELRDARATFRSTKSQVEVTV